MKLKLILLLTFCFCLLPLEAGSPVSGGPVADTGISTSDVTTNDVTSGKHGFAPKSPADASKFLNGAATPDYISLPVGHTIIVHAAGTAYGLTTTPTALDFGTTDPVLVIDQAGTYRIDARVKLSPTVTGTSADYIAPLKLRRTNNTAADLANSSTNFEDNSFTPYTAQFVDHVVTLPTVTYTTALTNDSITIFGNSSVNMGGTLEIDEATIIATRLY